MKNLELILLVTTLFIILCLLFTVLGISSRIRNLELPESDFDSSSIDRGFQNIMKYMGSIGENQSRIIDNRLNALTRSINDNSAREQKAINENFLLLRRENSQQMDKIRESVSDKLDKTLNMQFDRSFKGVIEQMSRLQNSMGELKGLSQQVGNLEKSLNGIKTRGIIGENQLKMLISDILTPVQYEIEIPTIPGSYDHVEVAVKIPSKEDSSFLYLPIDSKCHIDRYEQLIEATESGNRELIALARREFRNAIKKDASDIYNKYVSIPYTTPYAILFVPFEGMYSEIISLNLLEELNDMHITVAGPYTLSAILSTVNNYWQMLAIERKSNEIERTLINTRTAFEKFSDLTDQIKKNLDSASNKLETLQTTRTNAVLRALRGLDSLDAGD